MKVSYTGIKQELPPKLQAKLDSKFAKLSKLLERRGEREAHVIVTHERHLQHAEVTIQFYDHQLVGEGSDPDLFTALSQALDKIESQALKQRGKWREHRREDRPSLETPPAASAAKTAKTAKTAKSNAKPDGAGGGPRVFRVTPARKKPITLDEALLLLDAKRDYLVYRDATTERMNVLIRRRDGNLDLIES